MEREGRGDLKGKKQMESETQSEREERQLRAGAGEVGA